ncbi:MAG: Transcriptional regulatory protein AfsQ1 [Phycisphaerae bacterium]|nr:Transcriptional regulatory protein AfsQ1 [Phycisphaerae bacterium]
MSKPQVLVVDDDAGIRDALDVRLTECGYDVATAASAEQGIEAFDRLNPQAVILDVKMPGRDGFSVCEHIRAAESDVPVILLTGADDGVIRRHLDTLARTVGASRYLTKPFDGRTLLALLDDVLDGAQT